MKDLFSFFKKGNDVTVRIWLSKDEKGHETSPKKIVAAQIANHLNGKNKPTGNVGHASVETPSTYTSRWPGGKLTTPKGRVPGRHGPSRPDGQDYIATPQDDIEVEGNPDTEMTFKTLDSKAISEEHHQLVENYALGGPKEGMKSNEKGPALNCSSAAYAVLKAGGINELSSSCRALLKFNIFDPLSPNKLNKCVIDAKKEEDRRLASTPSVGR